LIMFAESCSSDSIRAFFDDEALLHNFFDLLISPDPRERSLVTRLISAMGERSEDLRFVLLEKILHSMISIKKADKDHIPSRMASSVIEIFKQYSNIFIFHHLKIFFQLYDRQN